MPLTPIPLIKKLGVPAKVAEGWRVAFGTSRPISVRSKDSESIISCSLIAVTLTGKSCAAIAFARFCDVTIIYSIFEVSISWPKSCVLKINIVINK